MTRALVRDPMPLREIKPRPNVMITALDRLRPIRGLPIWARYVLTLVIVLVFFAARAFLTELQSSPFLLFLPAVVLASFLFDRGSGFVATFFSTALAIYFFIPPRGSFVFQDVGAVVSVTVFLLVGLFTASIIEALRSTVDALVTNETSLGNSLGLLEAVIEGTPDPIFVKDREGRFVRVNLVLARIFGATPDTVRGKRDRDFLPEAHAGPIEAADRKVIETGMPLVVEELVKVAGQGQRYFLSTKAPWYNRDGEIIGLIGISQDIHDRKQAELEVRSANAQKEILLHDINHRVKNHLQSVMSLLAMSNRRIADQTAKTEIANAVSRLGVLARVYDRLQVKTDAGTASVNVRSYLQGLCEEVAPTLTALRPVVLRTQLDDADLDAGRAVSLGLAANELIQNSLKHAFPDDRSGSIIVRFSRADPDIFCLEVEDDGVGMPLSGKQSSTGTRLVRALAQQLGGTVTWDGPPGVRVRLAWPSSPVD